MTAKEYLSQIRLLESEIKQDKHRLAELDSEIGGLKAIDYAKDKIQTSTTTDLSSEISKLMDLQKQVATEISELQSKKQKITSEIRQLSNTDYVTLLTMRYVNCARWEQIAVDMNITLRWVYQIHGNALKAFKELNMR